MRLGDEVGVEAPSDPRLAHLGLQANLEWVRRGRSPAHRPVRPTDVDTTGAITLADVAPRWGTALPDAMKPYLGAVGATHGLLDAPWSVSSRFDALTNCLYRFFTEVVLGMKAPDDLEDDGSAAELGTLVHHALEGPAFADPSIWIAKDGTDSRLADALDREVRAAFDTQQATRDPSALQRATAEGLRDRWLTHLRTVWAPKRVKTDATANEPTSTELRRAASKVPAIQAVDAAWGQLPTSKAKDALDVKQQVDDAVAGTGSVPTVESITRVKAYLGCADTAAALTAAVNEARTPAVQNQLSAIREALLVSRAPTETHWAELAFGPGAEHEGLDSVTLHLGAHDVPIRGSIDRLDRRPVSTGSALVIIDYKTGRALSGPDLERAVRSLERPQLPVYALALDAALQTPEGRSILGQSRVAAVAYDFLREPKGALTELPMTADDLVRVKAVLETLVSAAVAGDFWLAPLTDDPKDGRKSWGFPKGRLDLRRVSRFEAAVPTAEHDEDES